MFVKTITTPDPGAGTEYTQTVPAGEIWLVQSLRLLFTTSGTAANRLPTFILDDGSNTLYQTRDPNAQTATLTNMVYSAITGLSNELIPAAASGARAFLYLPPLFLLPTYRIRTSTAAIQVGDDYSSPTLQVQVFTIQDKLPAMGGG